MEAVMCRQCKTCAFHPSSPESKNGYLEGMAYAFAFGYRFYCHKPHQTDGSEWPAVTSIQNRDDMRVCRGWYEKYGAEMDNDAINTMKEPNQ